MARAATLCQLARRAGVAAVAALLCLVGGATSPARAAPPHRIVSLNLCTDELVLLLADRDRIASLSFLAADPASSVMAAEVRGIRLNHGLAEEVLPLHPDLVLAGAGAHAAGYTVNLLRRLGYRVVTLPLATSLADVPIHIRMVAKAIGERGRGEALIARFRAAMAAIPPVAGPKPLAALYEANGISSGADTLAASAIRAAGFTNLAGRRGLRGLAYLPLETVIAARPDLLVLGRAGRNLPSLAAQALKHPAIRAAFPKIHRVTIDQNLWACPIPAIAIAVRRLAEARVRLAADARRAGR